MKRGVADRGAAGELVAVAVGVVVATILVAAVTAGAVAFAASAGIPFSDLSRDPAAVVHQPNYVGYYANATILLWQVPATSALLVSAVARMAGRRRESLMFLVGGLITAVMAVDDFFLLHESLNEIGLSQKAEPLLYGVAIAAFTWFFRRTVRFGIVYIALAMGAWGISAVLDALDVEVSFVAEDGAKLLGVAFWTVMVMRLVLAELRAVTIQAPAAPVATDHPADPTDLDDPADGDLDEAGRGDRHDEPAPERPVRRAGPAPARSPLDDPATVPVAVVHPQRPQHPQRPRAERAREPYPTMPPMAAPGRHARHRAVEAESTRAIHHVDAETIGTSQVVPRHVPALGASRRNGQAPVNGHTNGRRSNGHRRDDGGTDGREPRRRH